LRRQAVVSVQASPSRSRRHFHIVALGRSTTPPDGDLPGTAQPFRNGSTMLVITTSTRPSTVSRLVHAIRQPACSVANGRFDRCETRSPARLSSSVGRSRTLFRARHEGLSSSLLRARSIEAFETRPALPTSRVVANSSPRRKQERRVLHEGASFVLYAGISRGGAGLAVAASLGVLTTWSPGLPHWPTGWAESLSGSLRGRVPG
jgi:hypothetical protein